MVTDVPFCKLTCFLSPQLGIYMHPVFSTEGNYPQTVIDRVQAQSSAQGLAASRLRPFTQEQIDYIRGTADFLGLNHYTSAYAYRNSSIIGTFVTPSHNEDAFVGTYMSESWPASAISAFHRVIFLLFFSNIVKSKIVWSIPAIKGLNNWSWMIMMNGWRTFQPQQSSRSFIIIISARRLLLDIGLILRLCIHRAPANLIRSLPAVKSKKLLQRGGNTELKSWSSSFMKFILPFLSICISTAIILLLIDVCFFHIVLTSAILGYLIRRC